jgi:hypothetical protein
MTTNFHRTAAWLHACGKERGNAKHLSVQMGCDAEEIAEWFDCVRVSDDDLDEVRRRIVRDLNSLGNAMKTGKIIGHIPVHLRVGALDALCDRDVTGNGVAYLSNMDKESSDIAVLDSNESKLNEDGTAVILEGGKIGKAPGYKPPDLKPFV